jgi:hypothetical protein
MLDHREPHSIAADFLPPQTHFFFVGCVAS